MSTTSGTEAPPAPIEFEFQAYDAMDFKTDHQPLIFFAFEGQPDPVISARFPEVEAMRLSIEKKREVTKDMTWFFSLVREGRHIPTVLVYIGQRWNRHRPHRKHLEFGGVNFYQILGVQTSYAAKELRDRGHTEATIVLPGRFHPRNLKKDPQGEREEETFVRTLVESFITANAPDTLRTRPLAPIAKICFTHFGNHEQTATHFFNRAVGAGIEVGNAVSEARHLIKLSPSKKTPLALAELLLGTKLILRSATSPKWRTIKGHSYGNNVRASLIYGVEGLRKAGFGLIAAVGQGSRHEPCLLKLHYRPKGGTEGLKKISLMGKGIVQDTGGLNLKTDQTMVRMHYDMAGAATVASVFRLVVEKELPLELVALLPLAENMIGPNAVPIHEVVRAYDGQTVEITDTDAEGRLVTGDALAYSEKHIRPDVSVTVATFCDMSDFGPDFLKVMVNDRNLEKRVAIAEGRSFEKVWPCPRLEYLNNVDDNFVGDDSDLKNDPGFHYHSEAMVFVSNFLYWDPSPWMYLDVAEVFESDADDYGAGPGFGVRFLWYFVKQFAH